MNKQEGLLEEFQQALCALHNEQRFDDLTVAEIIGVLEMFKWEVINQTPNKEEQTNGKD